MDKITEQDLANRGVKGLPDVPGLTTEEMQRKLEEIAREILIPKVNELVEGLNNANSNLKSIIAYKDISASEITVSSNSTDNVFIPAADIAMNGYINIGVIRFDAGAGLAVTGLKQYSDGLYIGVVNRGTSPITGTPSVRMLYVKNI